MTRQITSIVLFYTCYSAKRTEVHRHASREMMSISSNLDIGLHVGAFAIGFLLFKRTRVVRDHEWQRSRAVKSVGNHFKAEERVWEKDVKMDTNLSMEAEANLKGKVGAAVGSFSTNSESEVSTEVEVEMLVDAEHVRRAQARVSGDEQFEGGETNSTVGSVRKPSPMDALLDWIASFRGRDRKSERDATVKGNYKRGSNASPVIGIKDQSPLYSRLKQMRKTVPMEMISVTDLGAESVTIDDETNQVSEPIQREISLEEMAFA